MRDRRHRHHPGRDRRRLNEVASLEAAWNAIHDAKPAGWYVGRPSYHNERREWVMYAFDPSERPMVGLRNRG